MKAAIAEFLPCPLLSLGALDWIPFCNSVVPHVPPNLSVEGADSWRTGEPLVILVRREVVEPLDVTARQGAEDVPADQALDALFCCDGSACALAASPLRSQVLRPRDDVTSEASANQAHAGHP